MWMQQEWCQQHLRIYWLRHDNYVDVVVDTIHVASMDEIYVAYVDDEHADNHDHDDYKLK